MKNLFKVPFTMLLASVLFISCSKDQIAPENRGLEKDEPYKNITMLTTDKNQIIVESFDFAVRESINNPKLTEEEIGSVFIDRAYSLGLEKIEQEDYVYSKAFLSYAEIIRNANDHKISTEYINTINGLRENINNNDILTDFEREKLNNSIVFMNLFVEWQISIKDDYENVSQGWWDDWGKCAAGTLGGAITGAGALGIAGAGAGTLVLPVVGTVAVGTVGAVVGGVGGALTGAATFCD